MFVIPVSRSVSKYFRCFVEHFGGLIFVAVVMVLSLVKRSWL